MIQAVAKPIPLPRKRRRGNPNWGVPDWGILPHTPSIATEFEMQVQRLGLTKAEYVGSNELKLWCARNRNRVYVPEWLLEAWGMQVELIFKGVA
jgi:hypothetical protein